MSNNRISIIGTVGVPASYGGFETLVENLLDKDDTLKNITIYCSSKSYKNQLSRYKNAKLKFIPFEANGIQSIPYDIFSLIHASYKGTDNILILGVSGTIFLPIIKWFTKAKVITNIDGLEWKRDKWGHLAKKFLKLSESIAVRFSDVVIADNQAIADYIYNEYEQSAEVIAYGGDHAIVSKLQIADNNYALALCRIEPENNVEMILEGFSRLDKPLKFIGNWTSSDFGKRMKQKFDGFNNIEIIDSVYDLHKLQEYRQNCSFYVHGHSAGGTNPSLVEMMHFGKKILAFDCVYNRATTEDCTLYFSNAEDIVLKIKAINISDNDNAKKMKVIAERRYTWQIVKKQYFDLLE